MPLQLGAAQWRGCYCLYGNVIVMIMMLVPQQLLRGVPHPVARVADRGWKDSALHCWHAMQAVVPVVLPRHAVRPTFARGAAMCRHDH
jgi:hypothetical protein